VIDWLTFDVRGVLHRPISGGALVAFDDATGDVEWKTVRRKSVEGSASSTVQIRSGDVDPSGFASSLHFSGNPSKFLQGHNLYGSDDLPSLVYQCAAQAFTNALHVRAAGAFGHVDSIEQAATLHTLALALDSRPKRHDTVRAPAKTYRGSTVRPVATLPGQATHDVDSPHVRLSRVDVNYMADLGSDHDVLQWLAHARRFATFNNRAARADAASTVYFASGKSRRARLKFYAKGPEFIVNGPRALRGLADEQQSLVYRERALLADTASGKLRCEVGLHRVALEELGLRYAADWTTNTARYTWLSIMENFDMPSPADTVDTSALPKHLAFAYHAWKGGEDLRAPGRYSRAQWYRLRAELRALVGVDIAQPCADPLPPIVQAEPATLRARAWPRNVVELFPADDEPAPAALVAAGLYFEPRTDWRIRDRPAPVLLPKLPPTFCPWPRDPADRRDVA
jgi:hypothetical protein